MADLVSQGCQLEVPRSIKLPSGFIRKKGFICAKPAVYKIMTGKGLLVYLCKEHGESLCKNNPDELVKI